MLQTPQGDPAALGGFLYNNDQSRSLIIFVMMLTIIVMMLTMVI